MASKLEKVDELIFGIFAKKTDKQCLTYVSNIANNIPMYAWLCISADITTHVVTYIMSLVVD